MSEASWLKAGASTGLLAALLLILGFIFGPSGTPPGFEDSAEEVQAFVVDNHGELQAQVAFGFGALAAFLWFLGNLFFRLRPSESVPRLSAVALAGGVALAVGGMMGTAAQAAAAYRPETIDPGPVLALWDMSIFGYLFFLVGFSVLAVATGVLALRTGALPQPAGGYSLLAGCYAFVVGLIASFSETGAFSPSDGALGLIAFLAFLVWLIVVSATLVTRPAEEPSHTAGGPPPTP